MPKTPLLPNLKAADAGTLSAWIKARRANLPDSRFSRTAIGLGFVLGGLFSFLPLLGIWMLPLGLVILSVDWPLVRRMRRKSEVGVLRRWRARTAASPA